MSGLEPVPDGTVILGATIECQHAATRAKVEEAWRADRARQAWVPAAAEEFEHDDEA